MSDLAESAFHNFRVRTGLWAGGFVVVSVVALVVVSVTGLSASWATAISSVFGTTLAVGLVALVFEFGLRRGFGHDLYRFLKLKEALVLSGLSEVGASQQADDRSLAEIRRLSYIGRSPTHWLNEHLPALLRAGEQGRVTITIALPDPENEGVVLTAATSLGVEPDKLADAIRSFRGFAESQWAMAENRLREETQLKLIYLGTSPSFDAYLSDRAFTLLLAKPLAHDVTDDLLALRFESSVDRYPTSWVSSAFDALDKENAIFQRQKKDRDDGI